VVNDSATERMRAHPVRAFVRARATSFVECFTTSPVTVLSPNSMRLPGGRCGLAQLLTFARHVVVLALARARNGYDGCSAGARRARLGRAEVGLGHAARAFELGFTRLAQDERQAAE